jgi:hypothetical protein
MGFEPIAHFGNKHRAPLVIKARRFYTAWLPTILVINGSKAADSVDPSRPFTSSQVAA